MPQTWFVKKNGKVHGPFDSGQLKQLARTGKVVADSQLAQSADGPWFAADRIKGLFVTDGSASTSAGTPAPALEGKASGGANPPAIATPAIPLSQILQAGAAAANTFREQLSTSVPASAAPALPDPVDASPMGFWQWYRHTYHATGIFNRFLMWWMFLGWLWLPWKWASSAHAMPYAKKAAGLLTVAYLAMMCTVAARKERLEGYVVGKKTTGMREEYQFVERGGRVQLDELEKKRVYDHEYTVRVLTDEDKAKSIALEKTLLVVAALLIAATFYVSRPRRAANGEN